MLSPGLSPHQQTTVSDYLARIGHVPAGVVVPLFSDVDVAAARALDIRHTLRLQRRTPGRTITADEMLSCASVLGRVCVEHAVSLTTAAFAYGCALGLRLGREFAPRMRRPRQSLSEDYAKLHDTNKREAAKFIRGLLRIQNPASVQRRTSAKALADDVNSARRWAHDAGKLARQVR
jgi:hypothetical protein